MPSNKPEPAMRCAAWRGIVLGLLALLGVEIAATSEWPGPRSTKPVAARVSAFTSPILQPESFLTFGAAALVILLITKSVRNRAFDGCADDATVPNPAELEPALLHLRKLSITQHVGGLYGP